VKSGVVVLAKQVANMDLLSNGRLIIGVEWMREEAAMAGVPFDGRGGRTNEYVAAIRACCGARTVWPICGANADFTGARSFPKPVGNARRLSVIIGGSGPATTRSRPRSRRYPARLTLCAPPPGLVGFRNSLRSRRGFKLCAHTRSRSRGSVGSDPLRVGVRAGVVGARRAKSPPGVVIVRCSGRRTRRVRFTVDARRRSGCGRCVRFWRSLRIVRRSSSVVGVGAESSPRRCRASARTVSYEVGYWPVRSRARNLKLGGTVVEVDQQVAGLLAGPGSGRMAGRAQDAHVAAADFQHKEVADPFQGYRAVEGRSLRPAWRRPVSAGTVARSYRWTGDGAGGSRRCLRIPRIVDAPTRWPSLSSSPWIPL
jgi:hypothetical protein